MHSYGPGGELLPGPCGDGFTGDGKGPEGCRDYDECLEFPCPTSKICTESSSDTDIAIGTYSCTDPNAQIYLAAAALALTFVCLLGIGWWRRGQEAEYDDEYMEGDSDYPLRSHRKDKHGRKKKKKKHRGGKQSSSDSDSENPPVVPAVRGRSSSSDSDGARP